MCEKIGNRVYNYLIGFEINNFNTHKLPSNRDVLNLFMYKHKSLKLNIRVSSSSVISDTNAVWASFSIPTIRPQHSIRKLESLYSDYVKLKKRRIGGKASKPHQINIEQFSQRLDGLFDIANCATVKNLPEGVQKVLSEYREGNRNVRVPGIHVSPEQICENQSAMEQEIPNNANENVMGEIGKF